MSEAVAYDVVLRDGSTARIRSAGPDDAPAMRDFLAGLSDRARWFRFFSGAVNLDIAARDAVAPADGRALLVLTGSPERVVGHALWVRTGSDEAEVAFAVDGAWQGRGLATTLLAHLAGDAARHGVDVFTAITLSENHRMIGVFRDSGFPVEVKAHPGELHVRFPTSLTEEGLLRFEARERDAAVAALQHVLRPATVIVLAAAARRGTVEGELLHNLGGFAGALHVVGEVAGVGDVTGPVDLAVLALPAPDVGAAASALAARGDVRALAVLATEGGEVQSFDKLLATCRAAGMRLVGPNSLGVVTTDPAIGLNATYAPALPPPGRVGFATQSGASGIAALDQAAAHGVALSSFVSMGAKADLSGNDMLQHWEQDGATDAVMLYLESFGNPRRFGRIARRVAAAKPVIAVKSGRAAAPPEGGSQTSVLVSAADTSVDALFRHAGVIRTDTLAEMFDVAALLTRQPAPAGDRVAIVTNAGGLGLQCVDACEAAGLRIATPAGAALASDPRTRATIGKTIDMTAAASADDYRRAVAAAAGDPGVDAVIALFARSLGTRAADVAEAVERAAAGDIPVLAVFMGAPGPGRSATVPLFAAPEDAARALARAVADARRRAEPPDPMPALAGVDADRAAAVVADGLATGGGWLPPDQVEALLACYGVPFAEGRVAPSPRAAARAAAQLGGAVAVKVLAPGSVRKSDIAGVLLDLRGPVAVERAARGVLTAARAAGHVPDGVLVQRMAEAGTELLVGVAADPRLGPLVAVGAGGATAELVGDVQVRLAPVGPREAGAMLRALRTFPLLDGFRGRPPADLAAVEDVVLRIGALAAAHPDVAELDCNPVVAGPGGAAVVDARVRLQPPPPPAPYAAVGRF
jgi:acyl-CoA synthetase (NDP forming)/GNAT superfamily N-acetyltransferase